MGEARCHTATLLRVAAVTPRVLRLTFAAPGFRRTGRADEWVGIFFGEAGDHRRRRTYTIRAVRGDEVDVDVVLHESGVAVEWARAAAPGDRLSWWEEVGGAHDPPADTDWQLLVGDIAALPAIGRIVEELPAGARAIVVAEVFDPADRQTWESAGDVEVHWLHASGEGRAPSRLEGVVRTFVEPPGQGYVWMAGEVRTVRGARRHLRHERGLPRERYALTGYWRIDNEAWMRRYEPLAAELEALWAREAASGRDPEEIVDAYEAALERAGL